MAITSEDFNKLQQMCAAYDSYIGLSLGDASSLKMAREQIKHCLVNKAPIPIKILNDYNRESFLRQMKHRPNNEINNAILLGKTEFYLKTNRPSYRFMKIMTDICDLLGILI